MENYYTDCSGEKMVDPEGIYTEDAHPCIICFEGTHRTDINFEAPVHGGDCLQLLWKEYVAASQRAGGYERGL